MKESKLRIFLNRLLLIPHGSNLLTKGGGFWIFGARLIILIMALTEGFIWAYLGSFFGKESFGNAGAILTGVFMFSLIWIIDATFITLDTSKAFYERKLSNNPDTNLKKEAVKLIGGIVARVLIVTLSLTISAPYLAQMVLENDITSKIINENNHIISSKRAELSKEFDTRLNQLNIDWSETQKERVLEAAGKGTSGKYGRGDALKTVELKIDDLTKEIRKAETNKQNVLSKYDALTTEEKMVRYNLELNKDGLKTRNRIIEEFKNDVSFINANYAVKAFLVFLFCGLLVLKIFQPRSIRIYFNEQLQDLFEQYKAHFFDQWLEPHELPNNGRLMPPMRFEDWCIHSYSIVKKEDENNRFFLRVRNEYKKKHEVLASLLEDASNECTPMIDKRTLALENVELLKNKENTINNEIKAQEKYLFEHSESIQNIEEQINSNTINGKELGSVMKIKNDLIDCVKSAEKEIIKLKNEHFSTNVNLDKNKDSADLLKISIEAKNNEIADYNGEIINLRKEYASKTLSKSIYNLD